MLKVTSKCYKFTIFFRKEREREKRDEIKDNEWVVAEHTFMTFCSKTADFDSCIYVQKFHSFSFVVKSLF